MPVKFWQMIVRFWFFLSYLITTVLLGHALKVERRKKKIGAWEMFLFILIEKNMMENVGGNIYKTGT